MSARELVSHRALAVAQRLGQAVRPLALETNRRHVLVGSGVLLRLGSQALLFTAAHVLDQRELLVGLPSGFVKLEGEAIKSTPPPGKQRVDDRADIGIVSIRDDLRGSLAGMQVLGPPDLDVNDQGLDVSPTKHYLVIGFPSSKATFSVPRRLARFEGLVMTSRPAQRSEYRRLGVMDHSHVVLDFDQKTTKSADGRSIAPKLNGVSGGGVWTLGDSFDADGVGAKLVAIAMECHRLPRTIVGTRLSLFCEVLRQHRPDLEAFIPKSSRLRLKYGPA